jgi:dihydrofolate reductase
MSKIVYIATSVDGFIAREDGDINWLSEYENPDNSDFGYSDFMEKIDYLLMGRKTYEKVLTFGDWVYSKPVIVFTNKLKEVPENLIGKVTFSIKEPEEVLSELDLKNEKNFYIDGGLLIQYFLNKDLIDELIITRIPILLGKGIPLFSNINQELKLKHINTSIYNNTFVKSHYIRIRE